MIFPKIHNSKSIYWDVSFLVGIVGIIGYIITQGIYVDEYNNIGRAIGFFSVDLIHGPSVSRRTTKKS
jgi:hypothetical protein